MLLCENYHYSLPKIKCHGIILLVHVYECAEAVVISGAQVK